MKNLPEKIYLTTGPVDPDVDFKDLSEVSWCTERIEKTDPEYLLMPDIKAEAEKLFLDMAWPIVNSTILVNFLRMPEEHKIHLLASIKERRPDLFNQWKPFPENKPEKEYETYLIWREGRWTHDLWIRGRWYHSGSVSKVDAFMEIPEFKPEETK